MNNILILSKIKKELKKRNLKSNKEVLFEIDKMVRKELKYFFDALEYEMRIKGKKTTSKKDILDLKNKMEQKEKFYDNL